MRIAKFAGLIPAQSDRNLPPGFASRAVNIRVVNGALEAIRKPKPIGRCQGVFVLDDSGSFGCGQKCSLPAQGCHGSIRVKDNTLVTKDGNRLIPATPSQPPAFATPIKTGDFVTSFRVTSVNQDGVESGGSPVLGPVGIALGSTIEIAAPGSNVLYAAMPTSQSMALPTDGSVGATWVRVGAFTDSIRFKLDPRTWEIMPGEYLDSRCAPYPVECLARDELGYAYAWNKATVWISEKNDPTLWTIRGQVTVEYNIEYAVATSDGLIVLTNASPLFIQALANNNGDMIPRAELLPVMHPLVGGSKNTSVIPGGVVYNSTGGLILLYPKAANSFRLLTAGVVNQEDWPDWSPTTLAVHRGRIVTDKWYLDYDDQNYGRQETSTISHHSFPADYLQALPDGRLLHYKDGEVSLWDAGDYARAIYESEIDIEQGKRIFTAAKVVGKNLAGVRFDLLDADSGETIYTKTLSAADNNRPFRLTARRRQHYKVRLTLPESEKRVIINEVHIAADINDLAAAEGVKT